ncbi:hypothetical protein ACI4CV_27770, partial [Klebsiella pneumoniae]|uniref:hypothetical protein n=1 Tax=Klebsiella pneumoniae TaxID=573 RepID=UPI00385310F6
TVDGEDIELLDKLEKLCRLDGRAEVFQEALVLLGWAASAVNDGLKIAAIDERNNRYREVETKALQRARKREAPQAQAN